jgi:uncharacterized membrane protein YgdD (TMEM256/DUF423 family)
MHRKILLWGLILSLISVAFGAFGAHALKQLVLPEKVALFETGVRYQFLHAFALILLALYVPQNNNDIFNLKGIVRAFNFFLLGILFFSGSLYLLTFQPLCSYNFSKLAGPITPIGGLFLMLGWATWAKLVWQHKVDK